MSFAHSKATRDRLRQAANFQVEGLERRVLLSSAIAAFGAQQTFAVGNKPDFVVAADLNRDGKPDVVATNQSDNAVGVLLGNGDGTFQPPRSLATGSVPASLAAADLDGDGVLDLAVANLGGDSVSVLLGNGNGTFQPQQTLSTGTGSRPYSIAAADVNGDGKADLVVCNFGTRTVGVFLGNGNGTFQAQQTMAAGLEPSDVSVADINGDGRPDLVVANQGAGTVSVFLGNGNGTFQARQIVPVGLTGNFVAVADLNGDGKLDLVVTQNNYSVGVLLSNGNGTFGAVQTFADNSVPTSLAIADVNGDGKPDIVTGNYRGMAVGVLLGNGNGTFQLPRTFAAGSSPFSVTTSDLNHDGRQDLVVANNGSNNIGVLLGDVPPTVLSINRTSPPGPITGAGTVTYAVTFSEPVTGVDPTDFSVILNSEPVSAQVAVSGGGAVYTVTVSGYLHGTLGLLGLNLIDDGSIQDAAGNPLQPGSQLGFQPQQTFAVGSFSRSLTVADVNGDGKPDLIVANSGGGFPYSVSVLLGNGNGTFQSQITPTAGGEPVFATTGDLNGDGKPDLVVVNYRSSNVSVLLGNGNGTFQNQQTLAAGIQPYSLAIADVNGDGKLDLLVVNRNSNSLSVMLGNGNGTFSPQQTFAAGTSPVSLAVADVNSDGVPDVIIGGNPNHTVGVLLGNGNGSFQPLRGFATGTVPTSVAVADVNHDGKLDLVVTDSSLGAIGVLLGNGNGTFAAQQTFNARPPQSTFNEFPIGLALSDVNGDGQLDAAVWISNTSTVAFLLGNPDGTFQPLQTFLVGGANLDAINLADVNADGHPDLLAVSYFNAVTVSLGTTRGDFVGQTYNLVSTLDTIFGSSGADQFTLARDPDQVHIDWTYGSNVSQMAINDPNGLTINGNGGNDTITLDYSNGNPSPNIMHLNSGTGNFTINGLQGTNPLAGTALEIGRSTVFFSYSSADPIAAIQGYLHNGYNAGAWNGTPTATTGVITSTAAQANPNHNTAIGYADFADGQGVNTTANTIELTYTLYGDANLDHQVNSADLQILLFSLNRSGAWDQGDFNYDGQLNSADLQNLLFTLNTSLGSQATPTAPVAATATSAPSSRNDPSSQLMPAINTAGSTTTPFHHPHPARAAARKRR